MEDKRKQSIHAVLISLIVILFGVFIVLLIQCSLNSNKSNKLERNTILEFKNKKDIKGNIIKKKTASTSNMIEENNSILSNDINYGRGSDSVIFPNEEYIDDRPIGIDRSSEIYMKNHGQFTLPKDMEEELKLVNTEIYELYLHFMYKADNIPQSAKDPLLWGVKTFNEMSDGVGLIASCLPTIKLGKSINPSMLYTYGVVERTKDGSIFWMNNPQQGPFQMDENYGNRSALIFPEEIGLDEATKLRKAGLYVNGRASRTPSGSKYNYGDRFNPHDMIQKQISEINSMYGIYYKQLKEGKINTSHDYPLNDLGVYALMCTAYNSGGAFLSNPNGRATAYWFAPFNMEYSNIYKFCSLISRAPISDYIEDKAIQSLDDGKKYPHKPSSDLVVLDWIKEWEDNGWIPEGLLMDIDKIRLRGTYRARPTYAVKAIYMYMQAVHIFYGE